MNPSFSKLVNTILVYFFPLMMIDYYFIMRGININTLLVLPLIGILSLAALAEIMKYDKKGYIGMFKIWFAVSVLSIVFYAFNDTPINCYVETLKTGLFPMSFVFLGYRYNDPKINRNYLFACAFCFVVGFYLYFATPSYYTEFLFSVREQTWYMEQASYLTEDKLMEITRFCSFFAGSYVISFFSIPALVLSLDYITAQNSKKFQEKSHWKLYMYYVVAVTSFVAAILCQQRVSMACSILSFLYYIRIDFKNGNKTLIMMFVLILLFLLSLVFILGMTERFAVISDIIKERFDVLNFSVAYSERSNQNQAFDRMTDWSILTGLGFGSCGHAASAVGLKGINDGEFIKIFYEYGMVGFLFFVFMIARTIKRGWKNIKYLRAELIIVLFYLVACIGSSALTLFLSSIFFWFTIGRIWNDDYLYKLKKMKI